MWHHAWQHARIIGIHLKVHATGLLRTQWIGTVPKPHVRQMVPNWCQSILKLKTCKYNLCVAMLGPLMEVAGLAAQIVISDTENGSGQIIQSGALTNGLITVVAMQSQIMTSVPIIGFASTGPLRTVQCFPSRRNSMGIGWTASVLTSLSTHASFLRKARRLSDSSMKLMAPRCRHHQ